MKCLLKYQWVKLSRAYLPQGKGLMGYWAKLASRAAFRKGHALYCGYKNEVIPGMWSGGIVGLKSILGLKSRAQALEIMNELSALGYISYSLDPKTKKLTYQINDWVVKCSGAECSEGTVYASDGYGFICLPRDITQRLADSNRKFSESDAWLDLWCHTVWQDSGNIFSLLAPTVQFERRKALLTLETMGQRWKWEKTKVWRFFQKYTVRGGWMSALINAGEGIDVDLHLQRENRSKTIDKVAQRIRLNRTKLKSLQDTSTDYEELANSISAGYYIKNGIANQNEDLFYISVFITVSGKSYEELMWRKRQMVDMLKSMDTSAFWFQIIQ